jgi:DNA (cytosine-5)-methyltransferase 1
VTVKTISLFSGAMGLDLGLEDVGYEILACCEIDKWCCASIRENRPMVRVYEGSVSDLDPRDVARDADVVAGDFVLVGGPPCQSFSSAGKRAALNDPRGNLIFEYFRFVKSLQPKAFILENVGNLLTAAIKHRPIHLRPGKHWNLARYTREAIAAEDGNLSLDNEELSGSAFRYLLTEIESLGYSITFGILNAADYGAPQKRIRFCMLGYRDVGSDGMPEPTHGEPPLAPYVTLADVIGDLIDSPGVHSEYTDRVADFFRQVPPGGNWRCLSLSDQREALGPSFAAGGGKTGFMRRLSWDRPAPTLTTKANRKGTALCHPDRIRPLSVSEYKRIQGFPDEWILMGAMNQQYQQIGNAVPSQLGRALGQKVLATLKKRRVKKLLSMAELTAMTDRCVKTLRSYASNKQNGSRKQLNLFAHEHH